MNGERTMTRMIFNRRGGFTLLEVLLAIGVLTFVSVAIATIFGAIGDTLSRGKRISELNQFATRIESVMRRDFDNLSRDGFLVIRNEYADGGDLVPLFDGDADPRARRVDQLMFFSSGEYSSSRSDIYAGLTPRSDEARIYYGHGQMRAPDYSDNSAYLVPDLRDTMLDFGVRLGQPSTPGLPNPNEYAADWTLLRHVTVLAPPAPALSQVLPDYAAGGLYGYGADRDSVLFNFGEGYSQPGLPREAVADNAYQVALQPAITSIFWNAQRLDNQIFQAGSNPASTRPWGIKPIVNPVWIGFGNNGEQIQDARFSSGLVDVATTSLAEIQSVVTSAAVVPNEVVTRFGLTTRWWYFQYLGWDHPEEALIVPGAPSVDNFLKRYPFTVTSPAQQRGWMLNSLPVHPAESRTDGQINDPFYNERVTSPRIRYEKIPPDLAGSLTDAGGNQSSTTNRLVTAYAAASQEMLTRSIFVPRCTEFIVDWTFGEVFDDYSGEQDRTYPNLSRAALEDSIADLKGGADSSPRARALYKKFVWYGRDGWTLAPDGQQADLDGDGDRNYDDQDRTTFFYSRNGSRDGSISDERDDRLRSPGRVEDAMKQHNKAAIDDPLVNQYTAQDFAINMAKQAAMNPEHLLGRKPSERPNDSTFNGRRQIETTTFGYYVYDPGVMTQNVRDDLVINWPWPKLIRITFKLADPNDPGIETSYQVVFEVPSRDAD
ncbi:MAG: hypothetical protein ACI89L_001029 [Phycisphaerales bacterium]|jgi:hypothetical protein